MNKHSKKKAAIKAHAAAKAKRKEAKIAD